MKKLNENEVAVNNAGDGEAVVGTGDNVDPSKPLAPKLFGDPLARSIIDRHRKLRKKLRKAVD